MKKTNNIQNLSIAALTISMLFAMSCGRGGPDAPPDTTPPTVSETSPPNGQDKVPVNAAISVIFSEEMDPSTINNQTLSLTQSGLGISGSVTYRDKTAVFTPDDDLDASTEHIFTISIGVKDVAGNAMAAPYIYSFKTATPPDTVPPIVINVAPANSSNGVSITAPIAVTFSEEMRASTITVSTFKVSAAGNIAATKVTYDAVNNVATFVPADNAIAYGTTYTATIISGANGVKDLAGNTLASNYTWTFTTTLGDDTTPEPFRFAAQFDAALNKEFISEPITVSGINTWAAISVINGTYSVNGGPYTSVPGVVMNGQIVTVQQTSSSNFGTTTTAFLTIGGVTGVFSVTTLRDATAAGFTVSAVR